jgi:hypothetical protein
MSSQTDNAAHTTLTLDQRSELAYAINRAKTLIDMFVGDTLANGIKSDQKALVTAELVERELDQILNILQ